MSWAAGHGCGETFDMVDLVRAGPLRRCIPVSIIVCTPGVCRLVHLDHHDEPETRQ